MSIEDELTMEPNVPGWYGYSGGAQTLMFLLDLDGQWWVFASHGDVSKCEWGYIEQALGVWNLVQHARLRSPDQPVSRQDLADRLRVLAMADIASAKDGTRTAKVAAKAAAEAYRLAASMLEETEPVPVTEVVRTCPYCDHLTGVHDLGRGGCLKIVDGDRCLCGGTGEARVT